MKILATLYVYYALITPQIVIYEAVYKHHQVPSIHYVSHVRQSYLDRPPKFHLLFQSLINGVQSQARFCLFVTQPRQIELHALTRYLVPKLLNPTPILANYAIKHEQLLNAGVVRLINLPHFRR